MWHDLRQAVRTLGKHPAFAATAASVLALGMGLNTAIFSIVYAMLFRPLPVAAPHELVSIYQVFPSQPDRPAPIHHLYYDFLKTRNEAFTDITAHWAVPHTLRADGETDVVNAAWVLSNYFDVLGVKPIIGRTLLPAEDDVANTERAAVISHALWIRRFHRNPHIIGKRIVLALGDQPDMLFTVVGVMGPEFNGISEPWKPMQLWVTMAQGREQPETRWTGVAIARLKPGVSVEQAGAIVAVQGRQFYSRHSVRPEHEPRLVAYRTNDVRMPFNPSAAVVPARLAGAMMVVVATVLLVAGANIAGMLVARGVGRSGEIAVRRVLGAGPLRIVRQLLAESLLLSAAGALLGVVLAIWLLSGFRALTPVQFALDVSMEWGALIFTIAICATVGVMVGIMPAKQAISLDVLPWLAGSGTAQTTRTNRGPRHAITIPQVTFSLVLLLVAGVYIRGLLRVELAGRGYEPGNLIVVRPVLQTQPGERPSLRGARSGSDADLEARYAARTRRFYQQLLGRLRAIPGASDVAIAGSLPLLEPPARADWSVLPQEDFQAGERRGLGTERSSVSPDYFRTMGMVLISGRDFDDRDTRTTPKVAVVSASVAKRLWPGRDPAGRMLTMVNDWAQRNVPSESYEVVGLVGDTRAVLQERGERPTVYFPLGQEWRPWSGNVLVRGAGDARLLIPAIKDAVTGADPLADVVRVRTMTQAAGEILYPRRIAAVILAVSGMIALLLATIGVYGVVSYSVAQRTGEIGVRMALGAERRDIIRLVLREGGMVAAIGSPAGLALGYAAIRITSSKYLALPQLDVATFLITPLALVAVVLLACYLPARRAGCVEPMDVLRRA